MEFIPLVVIMIAMWALLILPQQKRTKALRQMLSELEVGDDVVTTGGIYGTISDFDGETVFLAINDASEIKIAKANIAEVIVYEVAE